MKGKGFDKDKSALVGERFGKLIAVYELSRWKRRKKYFCVCDCGGSSVTTANRLKSGNTRSCGCEKRTAAVTHGYNGTAVLRVWDDMKARCYRKSHKNYHNYGGRGIGVCDEWRKDAATFIAWAFSNGWKKGLQIDRRNNDGDYDPKNCRFVSSYTNIHNRREFKERNKTGYVGVYKPASGEVRYVAQISDKYINNGKRKHIGTYQTACGAVKARNKFIQENNLPHKLQEEL